MKLLGGVLDFFYPPRCLVCDKSGAIVHPACRPALAFILEPFCSYCGFPLASSASRCTSGLCVRPLPDRSLDLARSVFRHSGGARDGVLRLKYRGVSSVSEWLVSEMAGAAQRYGLDQAQGVVAVPLHTRRLRERGYNQAGLLAQGLAHYLHLPYLQSGLVRGRETRSQVGLNGSERLMNVQGAFEWRAAHLNKQNLILVDDVLTTGATLAECAAALKAGGAGRVMALTATREMRS